MTLKRNKSWLEEKLDQDIRVYKEMLDARDALRSDLSEKKLVPMRSVQHTFGTHLKKIVESDDPPPVIPQPSSGCPCPTSLAYFVSLTGEVDGVEFTSGYDSIDFIPFVGGVGCDCDPGIEDCTALNESPEIELLYSCPDPGDTVPLFTSFTIVCRFDGTDWWLDFSGNASGGAPICEGGVPSDLLSSENVGPKPCGGYSFNYDLGDTIWVIEVVFA